MAQKLVDTYQSNQWTAASFWAQVTAFQADGSTLDQVLDLILVQSIPAGNCVA